MSHCHRVNRRARDVSSKTKFERRNEGGEIEGYRLDILRKEKQRTKSEE